MSREDTLWKEYDEIKAILNKIEAVGTGAVDLADPHAREMLTDQLQKLQTQLDRNKALNAYYRKHKSFCRLSRSDRRGRRQAHRRLCRHLPALPVGKAPHPRL